MAVTPNEAGADGPDSEELDEADSADDFLRAVARAPAAVPTSASAPEEHPTRLAHFRLNGTLGRGGMGIVYRAQDEKLDREVALKVLPRDFADDPPRRRRFMREARLAASLTHPNVATVYEIGEAEGRIYIAMELVRGVTLRKRLERGRTTPAEAMPILKQIARGVAQAHAAGIAHRDLKPDNVMVADDGAVKVLDFGLAKPTEVVPDSSREVGVDDDPATLTQEGRIMGTPGYMSPEQATGRALDVRTDVFSLGVIAYECLSGKRPFVGETPMDVVIATSRDVPPPLTGVSPAVARLVERCLRKDPGDRPANASELLASLDALGAGSSDAPRPRSALVAMGLAAAVAGALALAVITARSSSPPEPRATADLDQKPQAPPSPVATPAASATEPAAAPASPAPSNVLPNVTAAADAPRTASSARARPRPSANEPTKVALTIAADAAVPAPPRGGVISTSPY